MKNRFRTHRSFDTQMLSERKRLEFNEGLNRTTRQLLVVDVNFRTTPDLFQNENYKELSASRLMRLRLRSGLFLRAMCTGFYDPPGIIRVGVHVVCAGRSQFG